MNAPDDSAKLSFLLEPALRCLGKLPSRDSLKGAFYVLLLSLGLASISFISGLGSLRKEIAEQTLSGSSYKSVILSCVAIIVKSVYESLKHTKEIGEVLAFFCVLVKAVLKCYANENRKRLTAEGSQE